MFLFGRGAQRALCRPRQGAHPVDLRAQAFVGGPAVGRQPQENRPRQHIVHRRGQRP